MGSQTGDARSSERRKINAVEIMLLASSMASARVAPPWGRERARELIDALLALATQHGVAQVAGERHSHRTDPAARAGRFQRCTGTGCARSRQGIWLLHSGTPRSIPTVALRQTAIRQVRNSAPVSSSLFFAPGRFSCRYRSYKHIQRRTHATC